MKRGRMRPVFRPDGVSFPGDQVMDDSSQLVDEIRRQQRDQLAASALSAEMSVSDALLAAWMTGYHDRDADIGRLRGLLHELLSFGLNSKIGVQTDLFRRVTEELNRGDVPKS